MHSRYTFYIVHYILCSYTAGHTVAVEPSKPSPITTHMLDISAGRPSAGVTVSLHRLYPGSKNAWEFVSRRSTNNNGRIQDFLPHSDSLTAGDYRLVFDVAKYRYESTGSKPEQSFFPEVTIQFRVEEAQVQVRQVLIIRSLDIIK